MKRPLLYSLLLSAVLPAAPLSASPARAQVTINEDALPKAAAPEKTPPQKTSPHKTPPHKVTPQNASPHTAPSHAEPSSPAPQAPAARRVGAPPDVPAAPPRPVIIVPPAVPVPTHPPVPPEDVKASADAKGETQTVGKGLRVLFSPDSSAMTQAMIDAVSAEGRKLAAQPGLRVTLWSSASGSTEDLSTPRRIALARALAVRSILIRAGVATTRIYPRATGLAAEGVTPPDRLDIVAEGAAPVPSSEAQFGAPSPKAPQ
ncbi:OmpA family protein [Swaminathania salitolerans]|uniref:OmpA-like domain-containing protein n=1 Tax=Swaminathania salitolerans TaxID=182838 RepID=A0A511BSK9_9PROT|nr:hypothetical protein [Swaminathania salitolerans]GBQ13405.1 hypothetical protein AA21291_1498 [Swaminathania salitolerans LMG 21291]GEL03311.1 hypothetical protein SSA02_24740 [Swaminathania salitolerans]